MCAKKIARLGDRAEDFERLGQHPTEIAEWEDGVRTTGKFGEYEWWYSDIKFDGGGSLVIVFFTAPMTAMVKGFEPNITFNLTYPDGTEWKDTCTLTAKEASYATDHCSVKIGKSFIEGDLHTYTIHYETEAVSADVRLKGNTPAWRPKTGRILFGEKKYFAWLPSVPEGTADVTITIDGETKTYTGTGYHDHNWGNIGMFWLMHHWYWGRAKIGPYQVISSYITARKEYGYEHFPVFMLAKDGRLLVDKGEYITYSQSDPEWDEVTQKHVHKTLVYDYNDGQSHYRITYRKEEIIERMSLTDTASMEAAKANSVQRLLLRLAGLEPAYVRMTGTAVIEVLEGDVVTERHESPALWELMYFGKDAEV